LSTSFDVTVKRVEVELEDRISSILVSIKSIKDDMLDFERMIAIDNQSESIRLQDLLRKKSGELNELSDSLVLTSKSAWMNFNELAQRCANQGCDPTLLEPIRVLCKNIDVIAADLLCYSLGH
jgi:hypothetical protein